MMDLFTGLVAQMDGLSGGAGWVGAGMLGAVLGWLLFVYLPAKDKQIKDLLADHTTQTRWLIEQWIGTAARKDAMFLTVLGKAGLLPPGEGSP